MPLQSQAATKVPRTQASRARRSPTTKRVLHEAWDGAGRRRCATTIGNDESVHAEDSVTNTRVAPPGMPAWGFPREL